MAEVGKMEWNFNDHYVLTLVDGAQYKFTDKKNGISVPLTDEMGDLMLNIYQLHHRLKQLGVSVTLSIVASMPPIALPQGNDKEDL